MNLLLKHSVYILETLTILAFAFSGMLLARKKNFDPVGMTIIAFITALGGGTLRDVILGNHPIYWITHSEYPVMIIIVSCLVYFFLKRDITTKWLLILDALGLALFTISSAQFGLVENLPLVVVAMLATCSATFGGLIRDVLCDEVPIIFQKASFYATASFLGAWFYIILNILHVEKSISILCAVIFIFCFRLLSIKYNWRFK